jgi:hypothetical protein
MAQGFAESRVIRIGTALRRYTGQAHPWFASRTRRLRSARHAITAHDAGIRTDRVRASDGGQANKIPGWLNPRPVVR